MSKRSSNAIRVGALVSGISLALMSAGCARSQTVDLRHADTAGKWQPPTDGAAADSSSSDNTHGRRLSELVAQSRRDLEARLNVNADAITVVEARQVIWPDSSAGCPMPGYDYLQVLTEGALIRLRAGVRIYQYYSGARGPAKLCEKPSGDDPPSRFEER